MGYPRRQQVDPYVSGVYHCISRCVRGEDLIESPERCRWVVRRLERLTRIFAIDVCDFAVMRNHVHLLLRTQPDVAFAWTDDEVARRWLSRPGGATPGDPAELVQQAVRDPARIADWRLRLSDLGWFHKLWKEPCSRMWNREDDQTGHLWQGRYRSIGCGDEAAVLMQAAYILLNPVHCGAEAELGDSPRTSMGRRMAAISAAIAAGRCRRGVKTYGQALLEPALPCDPGIDVRSLSDAEWSERLAKRVHERALREAAADLARRRPSRAIRSTPGHSGFMEHPAVDPARDLPREASVGIQPATSVDGPDAKTGLDATSRRDASVPCGMRPVVSRLAPDRPRSGVPRRENPWRGRSTMAMAASCTLVAFVEWTDLKGRVRRPDKAGWIDPARPRLVDRLARSGRLSNFAPAGFTSGSFDPDRSGGSPSKDRVQDVVDGSIQPPAD